MLEQIVEPLLQWFDENKRILPWRQDPTPYHVWISEIMLQQTRVEAVKAYYARFTQALPEVADLAACPQERLLKLWEGLGYYNRVKNMQKAAIQVMEEYGGKLPADYEKLLKLPGIGSYTAGAVSSIAYGIPQPAVDGNVLRVITRITEDPEDILKQSMKRKIKKTFGKLFPKTVRGTLIRALWNWEQQYVCQMEWQNVRYALSRSFAKPELPKPFWNIPKRRRKNSGKSKKRRFWLFKTVRNLPFINVLPRDFWQVCMSFQIRKDILTEKKFCPI